MKSRDIPRYPTSRQDTLPEVISLQRPLETTYALGVEVKQLNVAPWLAGNYFRGLSWHP